MNIKEVFEQCNDDDYVIDNHKRKWKVDKGDLSCDCGDINNFYSLKQIMELDFRKFCDVDWSKVEVDTKILVSNHGDVWHKRYFAKYENDKVCAFVGGATSFSKGGCYISWKYAKLYKEDGEEEKNGN